MPIKFKCKNYISFDTQTAKYVTCNHLLVVNKEPGDRVVCPACGSSQEVPFVVKKTAGKAPVHANQVSSTQAVVDRKVPERIETSGVQLTYSDFDPEVTCLKCGTLLDDGAKRCPRCGTGVRFKDEKPIEEMVIHPAGFQLWLTRLTTNGDRRQVEIVFHLIMASLWILIGAILLAAFRAVMIVAIFPWFGIAIGYFMLWRGWYKNQQDPLSRLTWWESIAWNLILAAIKMCRFRTLGSDQKPIIFENHDPGFADDELVALPNLAGFDVLDLEGTSLTDEGLKRLRHHPQLKYLVLRGTSVTPEGVLRLQQSIPICWIWQ